jgi:hypothetical protein
MPQRQHAEPDADFAEGIEISLTALEALRDGVEHGWGAAVARGASAKPSLTCGGTSLARGQAGHGAQWV